MDEHLALTILPKETLMTLYMVFVSLSFSILLGSILGIFCYLTAPSRLKENRSLHLFLQCFIDIGRSFPFAILIVALIPLTRLIVGTSLGNTAAIVPLSLAAAPFFGRVLEGVLQSVDKGLIEAAFIMGSSVRRIVFHVLIPEALPGIIRGITLTLINLIGYSTIAGLMGGGGLGKVAIQYGYHRFNTFIMCVTVSLIIILVGGFQWLGNYFAKKIEQKRGLR